MERGIREGMIVRSSDGEKLGKVIRCGADEFVIEKGFFFPKDYVVRYEQASVSGDEVLLSMPASGLREAGDRSGKEREQSAAGLGTELGTYASDTSGRPVEGRDQGARAGEAGLGHGASEEVRVPVQGGDARGEEARFEQDEIRVPVREEEVEIHKRPVVREEVRVSKTARREERRAEGDVRREDVEIEKEGDVEERGGGMKEPEQE